MTFTTDYIAPVVTDGHYAVTDDATGRTFTVTSEDDCQDDPRGWGWPVELMIYRADRNLSTDDPNGPLADVFRRVYSEHGNDALALTVTRRYARVFGTDDATRSAHVETASIRGSSQSDWAEAVIIADDAETARVMLATYRQYFQGDVWFVTDDATGDALGGIYADSPEDAVAQYIAQR